MCVCVSAYTHSNKLINEHEKKNRSIQSKPKYRQVSEKLTSCFKENVLLFASGFKIGSRYVTLAGLEFVNSLG